MRQLVLNMKAVKTRYLSKVARAAATLIAFAFCHLAYGQGLLATSPNSGSGILFNYGSEDRPAIKRKPVQYKVKKKPARKKVSTPMAAPSVAQQRPARSTPATPPVINEDAATEATAAAGACVDCDTTAAKPAGQLEKLNVAQNGVPAETDNASGGNSNASTIKKLMSASYEAAKKCRRVAKFKGGKKIICDVRRSKGLCATGVREAMQAAGISWGRGNGNQQGARLARHPKFEKFNGPMHKAPAGSVLTCGGGGHGYGHVEIVVVRNGQRMYCSDFCAQRPVCNASRYNNRVAYKFKGT